MSESAEIDERVDLDEENYMEEMDDDVEEQIDDDGGEDENAEGSAEEQDYEESPTEAGGKDQLPEGEKDNIAAGFVEDEQKPSLIDDDEKEKHDELLALPPHGSEVFIGGLPRDTCEDDLRDLCEPMGDIHEVRVLLNCPYYVVKLSFSVPREIGIFNKNLICCYCSGSVSERQGHWR